jgi:tetratricopeptide (TPR) repeat protein
MKNLIIKLAWLPLLLIQLSCMRPYHYFQDQSDTSSVASVPPRSVACDYGGNVLETAYAEQTIKPADTVMSPLPPPQELEPVKPPAQPLKIADNPKPEPPVVGPPQPPVIVPQRLEALPPTIVELPKKFEDLRAQMQQADKRNGEFFDDHNKRLARIEDEVTLMRNEFSAENSNIEARLKALESVPYAGPLNGDSAFLNDRGQIPEPDNSPLPFITIKPHRPHKPKQLAGLTDYARACREMAKASYTRVKDDNPLSPSAVDACLGLAALAEEEQDWETALQAYKHIDENFKKSPLRPEALHKLARCQMELEDYAVAGQTFRRLYNSYPGDKKLAKPAMLEAAECLALDGHPEEALREFQAIEYANSTNIYAQAARLGIAKLLREQKRYSEAEEVLNTALNSPFQQNREELKSELVELYLDTKNYASARQQLNDILTWHAGGPIKLTALKQLARAYQKDGDLANAARIFIQAAKEPPQDDGHTFECRLTAVDCYLDPQVNLPKLAAEQLDEMLVAINDAPADVRAEIEPKVLFKSVEADRKTGQLALSMARIEELQRKYPSNELTKNLDIARARIRTMEGKDDEALVLLRNVIKNHPETSQASAAQTLLAEVQSNIKSVPDKENEIHETIVESDKKMSAQLKLNQAELLLNLGRNDEARDLLSSLINDPLQSKLILLKARWHSAILDHHAGRIKEALASYKAVKNLEVDPEIQTELKKDPNLATLMEDANWKISSIEGHNKTLESLKNMQLESSTEGEKL